MQPEVDEETLVPVDSVDEDEEGVWAKQLSPFVSAFVLHFGQKFFLHWLHWKPCL